MNDIEIDASSYLAAERKRRIQRNGKPHKGGRHKAREERLANRLRDIAILDFETDPFDAAKQQNVFPFMAVLYWHDPVDGEERSVTLWEGKERRERIPSTLPWQKYEYRTIEPWYDLVDLVLDAIRNLPGEFTVYAHNGGKFDYMFLLHRLRGQVMFKGRALMKAEIECADGRKHELRDSLHIIPTALRDANRKDDIDYRKMDKSVRIKHKEEISRYCLNDCRYTYEIVRRFLSEYGRELTIGSASLKKLKESTKYERLSNGEDTYLRNFYFGGRVECFKGAGHWRAADTGIRCFKAYDVNSMYPSVMANFVHPLGKPSAVYTDGRIRPDTFFVELTCDSAGAFLKRSEQTDRSELGDTILSAPHGRDHFFVSIHELEAALALGLIKNPLVHRTISFSSSGTFSAFVLPLYSERERIKRELDALPVYASEQRRELEIRSLFIKLLLNNAYGKFAQDPRRFKEVCITDVNCPYPPDFVAPTLQDALANWELRCAAKEAGEPQPKWKFWGYDDHVTAPHAFAQETYGDYAIWERTTEYKGYNFHNVATAASITGAARAQLMRAIFTARNPYYCDTDSIICDDLGDDVEIDSSRLGAWKLEAQISELAIAGKKQYAYRELPKVKQQQYSYYTPHGAAMWHCFNPVWKKAKVRHKGVSEVSLADIIALVEGQELTRYASKAPRIGRDQSQIYIERRIKATAHKFSTAA